VPARTGATKHIGNVAWWFITFVAMVAAALLAAFILWTVVT